MAEFLAELARRALVLSGLAVLLDVVLPQGSMRRLSRLVIAMLLMAAFVEPVMMVMLDVGAADVSAAVFADGVWGGDRGGQQYDNTDDIIAAGARLAAAANEEALAQLAHNMEQEIAGSVCEQAGLDDCRVEVKFAEVSLAAGGGDGVGQVLVLLSVNDAVDEAAVEGLGAKLAAQLAACYGLKVGDVRVSVVRYGEEYGRALGDEQ